MRPDYPGTHLEFTLLVSNRWIFPHVSKMIIYLDSSLNLTYQSYSVRGRIRWHASAHEQQLLQTRIFKDI